MVYELGSLICHQRPERSFLIGLATLPVCARCTGLYAGAAVAALIIMSRTRADRQSERGRPPTAARSRIVLAAAAVPALVSLIFEWTTGLTPSNELRALTGLVLGAAVAWLLIRLE
jgi:uncharacterized membrane protein